MKLFKAVLSLAFAAVAAARVDIEFDNTKVKPGKTYEVEWQSDQEYTLRLLLVRGFPDEDEGWNSVKTVFEDVDSKAGHETYNWTVPFDVESGSKYALWMQGTAGSDGSGYATITDWFSIKEAGSRHRCAKKIIRNFASVDSSMHTIAGAAFFCGLAAFAMRRRRARAQAAAVRLLESDATSEKTPQYVQVVGV